MNRRHLTDAELTEIADQVLAPDRRAAADAHLAGCGTCADRLAGTVSAIRAVQVLSGVAPPEYLQAHTMERLVDEGVEDIPCHQAHLLLHQHLDGDISPVAVLALARHVSGCSRCRAELGALSATSELVRSLPPVDAPHRIRQAVLAARSDREARVPLSIRWRPALAAVFAAAAVAGVLLLRGAARRGEGVDVTSVARELPSPLAPTIEVADAREQPTQPVEGTVEPRSEPDLVVEEEVRVAAGPVEPSIRFVSHALAHPPKGPTPAPVVAEASSQVFAAPAALRTLAVVASTVADDLGGQSELQLAEERFATMNSEAMWAELPDLPPHVDADEIYPVGVPPTGEPGAQEEPALRDSSPAPPSVPMRDGCVPSVRPLV